jgi:hypothetical protein
VAITNASDDQSIVGADWEHYCSAADVLVMLMRVVDDDARSSLQEVFTTDERSAVLDQCLLIAKHDFDLAARRDFLYHENIAIRADGPGGTQLDLGAAGFWPLVDVTALTIQSSLQTATTYTWDANGLVLPDPSGSGLTFTRGRLNVSATATWGWSTPPLRARLGQAYLAAAEALKFVARANSGDPAVLGGIEVVNYGALSVRQYQQGRFAPTIKDFIDKSTDYAYSYWRPTVISLAPDPTGSNEVDLTYVFGQAEYSEYVLGMQEGSSAGQ